MRKPRKHACKSRRVPKGETLISASALFRRSLAFALRLSPSHKIIACRNVDKVIDEMCQLAKGLDTAVTIGAITSQISEIPHLEHWQVEHARV
ncbi:hypothetical protein BD309DRAFT_972410 [Dichomitus squalens]|nr:hypothetical protein BD309DRAFT_972410 [Dichomitus squalens]